MRKWISFGFNLLNLQHKTSLSLFLHVSLRLVSAGWDDEEEKFFRTEASEVTNGCFLCVMKREVRKTERERIRKLFAKTDFF